VEIPDWNDEIEEKRNETLSGNNWIMLKKKLNVENLNYKKKSDI